MGMQRVKVLPAWSTAKMLAVLGLMGSMTACGDRPDPQLGWAKAALERNPQLEVVAVDAQAKVLTVRTKATGQVRTIAVNDIAAMPISDVTAAAIERAESPPSPANAETAVEETPEATEDPVAAPVATPALTQRDVRIERENGRIRVSGPGVSIVSAGPAASSAAVSPNKREADSTVICEGKRFMQLDSRNLDVDGVAIEARDGCELYVTNSRISASGTAIVARNATVHISNSQISGTTASLEAVGSAKFFLRASTFRGASRRDDRAAIQDLGGNEWR
jgi:hypothetical protein